MAASVQSIWRHPIKGFTPEPLDQVSLEVGGRLPFDRLFAVEDGPSGFDPAAPRHIAKQRFTVLAKIPAVARIRTALDDATRRLTATAPGHPAFEGDLTDPVQGEAFAAWLGAVLGDQVSGPLKLLQAPPAHRFMDDDQGYVSIINLASLEALAEAMGQPVDPLRLRGNLYVRDWPAWAEAGLAGAALQVGEVRLEGIKTIPRCVATHVNPATGERDLELVRGLFDGFGHTHCGLYAKVTQGGRLRIGDPLTVVS